jgi:hypothetical protein
MKEPEYVGNAGSIVRIFLGVSSKFRDPEILRSSYPLSGLMRVLLLVLPSIAFAPGLVAVAEAPSANSTLFATSAEVLGDAEDGVVMRLHFRYELEPAAAKGELYISGAVTQNREVVRHFRLILTPREAHQAETVLTLPEGPANVESRLMLQSREGLPQMIAKAVIDVALTRTGREFVAETGDEPEALLAEGVIPDLSGSVRLKPPRRDLAPNLSSESRPLEPRTLCDRSAGGLASIGRLPSSDGVARG